MVLQVLLDDVLLDMYMQLAPLACVSSTSAQLLSSLSDFIASVCNPRDVITVFLEAIDTLANRWAPGVFIATAIHVL